MLSNILLTPQIAIPRLHGSAGRGLVVCVEMSQEPARECPKCGAKKVRRRARPGRTTPFRNMQALAVPEDFGIPTCGRCHHEFLDDETSAALQPLLQAAYQRALQRRVRQAIDAVTRYTSQRRLEQLLGLSQGYLSRLRAGAGTPSPELVSNLALIARDPPTRLRELERYWGEPDGDLPPLYGEPRPALR